jgi:hypothetical protein
LEAIRLHYTSRVDKGEDGQDDVLRERSPGHAEAGEAGVNQCQFVRIGAGVALLRRCWRMGRNSQLMTFKRTYEKRAEGAIPIVPIAAIRRNRSPANDMR